IGMLFGPAQVLARICEFSFGRSVHPLWSARFAAGLLVTAFVPLALLPFSTPVAAAFAVMFGMANGLMTIARGTVPLALFGASGYGLLGGRTGGPFLAVRPVARVWVAPIPDRPPAGLAWPAAAASAPGSLLCLGAMRGRA